MEILPIAGLTFHPYVKETKKASKTTHALEHPTQYAKVFYFTCTVSPKTECFSLLHFTTKQLFPEDTELEHIEPPYIILPSKINSKNKVIIIIKASFLHYTQTENGKITFHSWFFSHTYTHMHI